MLIRSTFACLLASLAVIPTTVQAAVLITGRETESGVLFEGVGTLNLASLTKTTSFTSVTPFINAGLKSGALRLGADPSGRVDVYEGDITIGGPFGSGFTARGGLGTGDAFGLAPIDVSNDAVNEVGFAVPEGYVSGDPLAGTGLFRDQTFLSLGVEPGTYVYGFGSGVNADSLTLSIVVPEPAFAGGLVLGGLALLRRRAA